MAYRKTFNPAPDEVARACRLPLHPDAEIGIELYNQGEYFLAHEALEDAWNDEGEPERRLYQGILQAAVLSMHARNGNYRGVMTMNTRRLVWLSPWPHRCRGLDIGQLKADIDLLVEQVERLGPEKIDQIDLSLFTQIKRVKP
jgi:predicted metal-dependent hydrolase